MHDLLLTSPSHMTSDEEKQEKSEIYKFGDCVLDADRRELTMSGSPVTLQPKAFDFLLYLIRNRARAIDKDELQDALWPRSIVTETALTRVVMKARRAVGDDADTQTVVRTVHGHGYRFVAKLRAEEAVPAAAVPEPAAGKSDSTPLLRSVGAAAGIVAAIAIAWWYLTPPAYSGPIHLAVLPVENATGDAEWDWAETGFMALMSRMLEDRGVSVVSGRRVSGLAGDTPVDELLEPDSEFRRTLQQTTGYTHILGARLEFDQGLYRLTYTFATDNDRPVVRKFVDQEPTKLIEQAIVTISDLAQGKDPTPGDKRIISTDSFINEAYARGMSLEFEGQFEEAQRLFQVVIEQEPELFWPRYEYALCERMLRRHDSAEQQLIALRDELGEDGALDQRAAVNNALGVLYQLQRRNEEAQAVLEEAVALGQADESPTTMAIAHINLGLVARNLGDTMLAYEHMQQAAALYEQRDITSLPGSLTNNMSGILLNLGRLEEAEQLSVSAVENFRLTGQRLYESYALSRLSTVQRRLGLLDEAEATQLNALAIREELNDRRGVAISAINLGAIAYAKGDLTRARQFGEQARDIGIEIDDRDLSMGGIQQIAQAELRAGNYALAADLFGEAESMSKELGDPMNELRSRRGVARAWLKMGNFDGAEAIARELSQVATERGIEREQAGALNLHAEIHFARGEWDQAIAYLEESHALAIEIGDKEIEATTDEKLGLAWLEAGNVENAQPYVERAALARPNESDVIKLQAKLASLLGENGEAVRLMTIARTNAGEGWSDSDDAELERYRVAANASETK